MRSRGLSSPVGVALQNHYAQNISCTVNNGFTVLTRECMTQDSCFHLSRIKLMNDDFLSNNEVTGFNQSETNIIKGFCGYRFYHAMTKRVICISSIPMEDWKSKKVVLNHNDLQIRSMAGHNKWSKIKRKKGAKDASRALRFSKATRAIRAASRACNGDMSNLHLQSTIAAAKAMQVPKDRIKDAIAGQGGVGTGDYTTIRYDGYVSCNGTKIALIVMTLTDNRNRTAANVRAIMAKAGGEMLRTGSHDFLFEHIGIVSVTQNKHTGDEQQKESEWTEKEEEALFEYALDHAKAIDVEFHQSEEDNKVYGIVKCEPSDLYPCVSALRDAGYTTEEFESTYLPNEPMPTLSDNEEIDSLDILLNKLDQDDDVTVVFHNAKTIDVE